MEADGKVVSSEDGENGGKLSFGEIVYLLDWWPVRYSTYNSITKRKHVKICLIANYFCLISIEIEKRGARPKGSFCGVSWGKRDKMFFSKIR